MIKRIYADNFLCLGNFELRPKRLNLLLGENGSGRTGRPGWRARSRRWRATWGRIASASTPGRTRPSAAASTASWPAPRRRPSTSVSIALAEPFVPAPDVGLLPGAETIGGGDGSGDEGTLDDLASILFTSGTTIAPKAVPLTHGNYLANVRGLVPVMRLSRERLLSVLPIHHAFEQMVGLLVLIAGILILALRSVGLGLLTAIALVLALLTDFLLLPALLLWGHRTDTMEAASHDVVPAHT